MEKQENGEPEAAITYLNDNYGEFSRIREKLICIPEDKRLKRIAGNVLIMAQSGQYNFMRCIKHGEPENY